jgi:Ca2+-binding EF-hand superfamily protein
MQRVSVAALTGSSWLAPQNDGKHCIAVEAWCMHVQHMSALQNPQQAAHTAFAVMDRHQRGLVTMQAWLDAVRCVAPQVDRQAASDAFTGLAGTQNRALTRDKFLAVMSTN